MLDVKNTKLYISYGIVGCGNMSQAFFGRLFKDNKNKQRRVIMTYTPSNTRAHELADSIGGTSVKNLKYLNHTEVICLCFKPQQLKRFLTDAREIDFSGKTIVSILAGVDLKTLKEYFPNSPIIRLMPSMPVENGQGISLISHTDDVSKKVLDELELLSSKHSMVIKLEENLFDKLTLVTSSGPAFVYYLFASFAKSLEEAGIRKDNSKEIIHKLFLGALSMIKNDKRDVEDLIADVCSFKGVTAAGIEELGRQNVSESILGAIDKGVERSRELQSEVRSDLPNLQ